MQVPLQHLLKLRRHTRTLNKCKDASVHFDLSHHRAMKGNSRLIAPQQQTVQDESLEGLQSECKPETADDEVGRDAGGGRKVSKFTVAYGRVGGYNVGQVPLQQQSGITHCNQAALVLLVGAVRPQDGNHHGDGAHQVQHEEGRGPMGHLGEGQSDD